MIFISWVYSLWAISTKKSLLNLSLEFFLVLEHKFPRYIRIYCRFVNYYVPFLINLPTVLLASFNFDRSGLFLIFTGVGTVIINLLTSIKSLASFVNFILFTFFKSLEVISNVLSKFDFKLFILD